MAAITTTPISDPRRSGRRWSTVLLVVGLSWAGWRAGLSPGRINTRGFPNLLEFWAAATNPELAADFVRLTADAALTTLSLAVLGTAGSLVLGILGAAITSELLWGQHVAR